VKAFLEWVLLALALLQFLHEGLPPGNADLISVQSLAIDLSHNEPRFLYPGYGFERNDEWVAHHEANLRSVGQPKLEPNWCFYPPLIPFLLTPIAGASVNSWRMVWGVLQLLLLVAFAEVTVRLLVKSGATPSPHRVLIYALIFGCYPVERAVALGQTSILIALLLWIGIYARMLNKQIPAALSIGFAVFVKPFLALTELVNLARRKTRVALMSWGVVFGLLLLSIIAVGVAAHIEYWNLLRTLSTSLTAYAGNQSLLAGFLRFFSALPVMDYGFQFSPGLALAGRFLAVIILGVAAWAQWTSREVHALAATGLWISASLLALPISWEHHLLFLLPAIAYLWTARWNETGYALLGAATLCICLSVTALYGDTFSGRVAASVPLFGDLMVFVFLVTMHVRPRAFTRVHV
jgi:hypothetical protein